MKTRAAWCLWLLPCLLFAPQSANAQEPKTPDEEAAAVFRDIGATAFLKKDRLVEVNANRRPVTDVLLGSLSNCVALTDLSFEQSLVGPAGMAHLSNLPNLEWLNLYRTQVGDEGLAHIATLPKLQHLPIGDCGITDKGLEALKKNRTLVYLGLRANPVTNDGLAHLAGLTQLKQLHLGETNVTRLDALKNMKRLEKIWLTDLKLEDGELAAFRRAHPRCEIVR